MTVNPQIAALQMMLGGAQAMGGTRPQYNPLDLQRQYEDAQQRSSMGAALMSQGFEPNSGWGGALRALISPLIGKKIKEKSDAKLSDVLRQTWEYQKQATADEFARTKQADLAKIAEQERALISAGFDPGKAGAIARGLAKPKDFADPKKTMRDGYIFDESTGQATPIPGYAQEKARIAAAGRAPAGPSELQQRIELARSMGATPEQLRAMVVGASGGAANAQQQKQEQANALKGAQFDTLQRNLDRLDSAVQSIGGNAVFNGGPIDQYVLGPTEQGQELAQSSAQIMPILTALTRVPGVGSQSDLEARLNQLQLPSAEFSPEVNKRAMEGLRGYISDLQRALQTAGGAPQGMPAVGGGSNEDPFGIR